MRNKPQAPVALYTATLSMTEVGLGSLFHAFHVPMGGHLLSLNQGALLCWVARGADTRREGVQRTQAVSVLTALAKSFSPAGQRLFPMLAIATQGSRYSVGLLLLGLNPAGAELGMVLLSIWPFVQPLLVAYLLFGSSSLDA